MIHVNLIGVIYTTKLAVHYFNQQRSRDNCLILKSSLAGYIDSVSIPLYQTTKYGVRGMMRTYDNRIIFGSI